MAGNRSNFIQLMGKFAGLLPTKFMFSALPPMPILPFYHAISDNRLPHIDNLYKVKSTRQFTNDIDFLLKNFEAVSLKDLLNGKELNKKRPSFHLTFDDGLSEFNDLIAPILLAKGIPATCFLNSAFVDNNGLFYRYKASLLIDHINKDPEFKVELKSFSGTQEIHTYLLSIDYKNRHVLDQIAQRLEISFDDYLKRAKPYLTSLQIENLISQGFTFGSHSIDHPEYQYLNLEEQLQQTIESAEWVADKFNLGYKVFSFPFTDHNVSQPFFDLIQLQSDIQLTFGSAGMKKDTAKHHVQRIPFEMNNLTAKQVINGEALYYLVKSPLGKNEIYRHASV